MDGPEVVTVTRQGLYDQVWSMPVSRACKPYGLSDVGLAKICDQWDIPWPGLRGKPPYSTQSPIS